MNTCLTTWGRRLAAACLLLSLLACASAPQVSLPLRFAWFEGRQVGYVSTDASDAEAARAMGINHAPRLAATVPPDNAPPGQRHALERVYMFTDGAQINVFPSVPLPVGPASTDRAYSPLWRMVEVAWLPGATRRVLTSEEAVLDAVERGQLSLRITRVVVNCAVVSDANGGLLPGARLHH
jgi:hypothetical protein